MDEPDEAIDFTESAERSWRDFFSDFKEKVYPMFKEQGISYADAIIIWEISRLTNAVTNREL